MRLEHLSVCAEDGSRCSEDIVKKSQIAPLNAIIIIIIVVIIIIITYLSSAAVTVKAGSGSADHDCTSVSPLSPQTCAVGMAADPPQLLQHIRMVNPLVYVFFA